MAIFGKFRVGPAPSAGQRFGYGISRNRIGKKTASSAGSIYRSSEQQGQVIIFERGQFS